jgi:cytochrome c peroxidase
MKLSKILIPAAVASALAAGLGATSVAASGDGLEPIEKLGEKIFFDKMLSIRRNQACVSCHVPKAGWVGDDPEINEHGAVYEGSIKGEFGNRKPPSSAYASLAPIFYADFGNRLLPDNDDPADDPLFVGGNFWDGRATGWELGNPAADQAQGPFLNPVEQALPDAACVVYRVCEGNYGDLFDAVWSPGACMIDWSGSNVDTACGSTDGVVILSPQDRMKVNQAYDRVALSIAAFEGSSVSNAFTSKLDARRAGLYELSEQEALGRDIFRGKGNCSACHVGTPGPGAAPPLFTDFTYDNLGTPSNPENPFVLSNPGWEDPGLAGFLANVPGFATYAEANLGKQKVPTLRNVGLGSCEAVEDAEESSSRCFTKAYMHNGYFKSLWQVVHFYNTRDVKPVCPGDFTVEEALAYDEGKGCWPEPEVAENVNTDELGDLGLTEEEEVALVAFMLAMSDGYLDDDDKDKGKDKDKDEDD